MVLINSTPDRSTLNDSTESQATGTDEASNSVAPGLVASPTTDGSNVTAMTNDNSYTQITSTDEIRTLPRFNATPKMSSSWGAVTEIDGLCPLVPTGIS